MSSKINIKRKPHFNNHQIQRLLSQLMAKFAGYQVETGNQRDGKTRMRDVPVIYGDLSRVAAYLMGPRPGVENGTQYIPFISLNMVSMTRNNQRTQYPYYSEQFKAHRVEKDANGDIIVGRGGAQDIIERYMPVPYDVGITVSIWASNNFEGYQLVEQITSVFNPDQEIQLSNSPSDWSFLTNLFFDGNITFEKASQSGTDPLYVYNMNFSTTFWISMPAKTYEQKPIYTINVPIHDLDQGLDLTTTPLDTLIMRVSEDDKLIFENYQYDPDPSSNVTK